MNNSVKGKKVLRRFLVKAFLFYVVWQISYRYIIKPNGVIDDFLTESVIRGTSFGLAMVGFNSHIQKNIIFIDDNQAVRVENQCNGLELLALYVGFLVCFPGNRKFKLIYSVVGMIILFSTNIIREMLLAINYNYFRETFELNHKYTYTIVVYFIVFLMWKHWIERYSNVALKK